MRQLAFSYSGGGSHGYEHPPVGYSSDGDSRSISQDSGAMVKNPTDCSLSPNVSIG